MCNITLYIIRASAGNVVNPSDFNQQAILGGGVLMLHSINVSAAITLSVRHRQHNGAVFGLGASLHAQ